MSCHWLYAFLASCLIATNYGADKVMPGPTISCLEDKCGFSRKVGLEPDSLPDAKAGFCNSCLEFTEQSSRLQNAEGEMVGVWDPETGLVLHPSWCARCNAFVLSKKEENHRERRVKEIWGEWSRLNLRRHLRHEQGCPQCRKSRALAVCIDHKSPMAGCPVCKLCASPPGPVVIPCHSHVDHFLFTVYDCIKCKQPVLRIGSFDLFVSCPVCKRPSMSYGYAQDNTPIVIDETSTPTDTNPLQKSKIP